MLKRLTLAAAVVFFSGAALGESDFEDNDTDNDGKITRNEYYGFATDAGVYSIWDTNSDGLLSEDEFKKIGIDENFDEWDANKDGYIDEDEYYDGTFDYYDVDASGLLDGEEWDGGDELTR